MFSRLVARLQALLLLAVAALTLSAPEGLAQGRYVVGVGDVLQVEVLEDEALSRSVLVAPSGEVTLPLAGSIVASGQTLSAVQETITRRLAPNFANPPTVFVSLTRSALADPLLPQAEEALPVLGVYTLGEVGGAGLLQVPPGTTVLQGFALMGGFTPFAAVDRIQLRRRDPATGQERIYRLSYNAIIDGRSPNGSVPLRDGDVIVVPTRRLFE
jgi:polysaccharide export outer membrane protein